MAQPPAKRRKLWLDADMESAIDSVRNEKMTISAAARKHSVPRKSLDNRIKGRVKHGVKPGPATTLTAEEETALLEYIRYSASRGFPMTKQICKAYAWSIGRASGRNFNTEKGPSEKWWRGFKKRNPRLSLRTADRLDRG